MVEYHEFLWNMNKGFDLETVLKEFPYELQCRIKMSLLKNLVQAQSFLKGSNRAFRQRLVMCLQAAQP